MTDRELLQLAAKAAGYSLEWDGHPDDWKPMYYEGKTYHSFEPLTDDGDALRLAVKLRMHVNIYNTDTRVTADGVFLTQMHDADQHSATRRAIVRAAAEIGKAMK